MLDKDGNVVAVLTGDENREIISKEEMSHTSLMHLFR